MTVNISKTVLSVGRDISVFRFVDVGTRLVEAEGGMTENEANTMAVKTAIEAAVLELIEQGIIARLKIEWAKSGTDLSFDEWLQIDKK
jgi:predicted transcriptional regulator